MPNLPGVDTVFTVCHTVLALCVVLILGLCVHRGRTVSALWLSSILTIEVPAGVKRDTSPLLRSSSS
jgi:hypothetical protein